MLFSDAEFHIEQGAHFGVDIEVVDTHLDRADEEFAGGPIAVATRTRSVEATQCCGAYYARP